MSDVALAPDSALRQCLGYPKLAGDRLRVLLLDGSYHLYAECRRALEHFGHHVASVSVPKDGADRFVERLLWALVEERPDFVLSVNQFGFDEEGHIGALLEALEMPVAVWYVDSPLVILRGRRLPAPAVSTVFSWERTLVPTLRALGAADVHYLPLATDPQRFAPPMDAGMPAARPRAFVGDSLTLARQKWARRIPAGDRPRIQALAAELLEARRRGSLAAPTAECATSPHGCDLLAAATSEATATYRLTHLEAVTGPELHVFGDGAWGAILPTATLQGNVKYGEGLAAIYGSTAVNLNLTSLQMPTAVNQRVFDVPAAGGFVLTDAQPDLFEHFAEGREVVAFRDAGELGALARHYEAHPEQRRLIVERARQRILAEHTYVHRLQRLVAVMRERHARARGPRARPPSATCCAGESRTV